MPAPGSIRCDSCLERPMSTSDRIRALGLALSLLGCGGSARFHLRPPVTHDPDQKPFSPAPEVYESPWAWDAMNQTLFRPIARFFAFDPAERAINANAYDEVPNSSWFQNRLGFIPFDAAAVERGSCEGPPLDPHMPDGSWIIDKGKDNGANPGFRVNIPGVGKFMLKSDLPDEPERATGATAIASRMYYAAGYYAPCDSVVYFRPSLLTLKAGLTVTNNQGVTRRFDNAALQEILDGASHRDGLVRMVASAWLPGAPLGPYKYDGRRDDDPNDAIDHEDRRELRGGRLLAAWLNHFDSREQNTMDVFLPADPARKDGPGYVRHYIIDLGDSFGSIWSIDGFSRLFDNAYMFDVGYIAEDFVTLGIVARPWEKRERRGGIFNYFAETYFDPEGWRGEYPNPAFLRMTEADGAWMARILGRFDDRLVAAAVGVGKFEPAASEYLTRTLIARRQRLLARYLRRLSPLANVAVESTRLCALDVARHAHLVPLDVQPRARIFRGKELDQVSKVAVELAGEDRLCVTLAHAFPDAQPGQSARDRYVVVEITNGQAQGPLRAHLYDLGPNSGFRLVGIERPESAGENLPTF